MVALKAKNEKELQDKYDDLIRKIRKHQNDNDQLKSQLRVSRLPSRGPAPTLLNSLMPKQSNDKDKKKIKDLEDEIAKLNSQLRAMQEGNDLLQRDKNKLKKDEGKQRQKVKELEDKI